jgi:hypothetical protein
LVRSREEGMEGGREGGREGASRRPNGERLLVGMCSRGYERTARS